MRARYAVAAALVVGAAARLPIFRSQALSFSSGDAVTGLDLFNLDRAEDHGLEKPDSFLSVIEKMLHKYPAFKSKMYIMMKRNVDPETELIDSVSNGLSLPGTIPTPFEIYKRFKAILDAESMLRRDMQHELRSVKKYINILRMKKEDWMTAMKDLERDLVLLGERKKKAKDEIAGTEINSKFAVRYKQVKDIYQAYKKGEEWEKTLNLLLEELFP